MKLFNFFKKQAKAEEPSSNSVESSVFSNEALEEWPSIPEEGNKVPSLEQVISHGKDSAKHAENLQKWCESIKKEDDTLEYQVVMESSQYGLFTVPAMIRHADDSFIAFYSYVGEWSSEAIQRLLNWVISVRGCDFIHTFEISLCQSGKDLPPRVKEIISKKKCHRMMISLIPHLNKDKPRVNSRVFAEAFGFFYNENKILNYDHNCLSQVERWFKDEVRGCSKNSLYYQFYVYFIAGFFGQVLCESFKAEWQIYSGVDIVVVPANVLKPRKHGMMPGDMKVNVMQIVSDFVFNPRLESSLMTNFNLVDSETLKKA